MLKYRPTLEAYSLVPNYNNFNYELLNYLQAEIIMKYFNQISIVFLCFTFYYICPAKEIFLQETNNKSCHQLENKYSQQQMVCNKARLFTWCLPDCYNKDIEPWVNLDLGNAALPFYYNFEFVISSIHEVNDFEGTLIIEMFFII